MAHTDRDADDWKRMHHWRACPMQRSACLTCRKMPTPKYWCSTNGKPKWNRDQRRAERGTAKQLMERARNGHVEWDDLTIGYYRPYWD